MANVQIYRMTSGVRGAALTYTYTTATDYIEFTLTSWCSTTATCPEATRNFDFRITGFKNYPTTKPPTVPNSFTVVNFEGKKIEQIVGVNATASLSAGNLTNINLTRTSSVVGTFVTYSLTFTPQYGWGDTRGAYITLDIPTDMMFNPTGMTCTVKTNSIAVQPSSGTNNCTAYTLTPVDNFGPMVN